MIKRPRNSNPYSFVKEQFLGNLLIVDQVFLIVN
jgi:hypothetical protein